MDTATSSASGKSSPVPRRKWTFSLSDQVIKDKRHFPLGRHHREEFNESSPLMPYNSSPAPHTRLRQLLCPSRTPSFRNSFPQLPRKSRRRTGSIQHGEYTNTLASSGTESMVNSMRESSFGYNQDSIEIDILENSDSHFTMSVLRKCNRQVIRPFQFVLKLVAWEPIFSISSRDCICIRKFFNVLFAALTIIMLLISTIYQIIFISWNETTKPLNITSKTDDTAVRATQDTGTGTTIGESVETIIAIYVIPSFLQLIAFLLGYWHFRIMKSENVDVLMEKVFLNFVGCDRGRANQRWINVILRLYLGFCILWTLLSVASNFLYDHGFVYGLRRATTPCINNGCVYLLWVAETSGNFVSFAVTMVILFNFSVQCEAIISFMDCLLQKIQERYLELRDVLKDISFIKETIKALNGIPGIMMSIIVFTQANMSITGVLSISTHQASTLTTRQVYQYLSVLRALPLTIFPIILVCRVNRYSNRIHHSGVEARAYGYRNASQLELDSYVLLTMNNTFWAKLFMIPFRGFHLAAFIIIGGIVVVSLANTDVIKLPFI